MAYGARLSYSAWDGEGAGGSAGSGDRWRGAALRPTGLVVFATLEQPARRPARLTSAVLDGSRRLAQAPGASPLDVEEPGAPVAMAPDGATRRRWRRGVGRGAAWLLGR